ncbi:hypothetical protein AAFF_G00174430 [Aldrovandia affinis]|uniref:Uncharacterized protein n=1 Tax=Aldrovandia affinis TaxID=143900 RepID=A0AAD7RP02_9TELE|nr:hypothetical protein AAFF_G00174430 [Aldrovandia affinis]
MARMEKVLNDRGLVRVIATPEYDGPNFDQCRPDMWEVLRDYPTKIDPKSLKGETLGDTENPATYLHRQLKRWKQETERDPEGDPLMTTMFRRRTVYQQPPVYQQPQAYPQPQGYQGQIQGPVNPWGRPGQGY